MNGGGTTQPIKLYSLEYDILNNLWNNLTNTKKDIYVAQFNMDPDLVKIESVVETEHSFYNKYEELDENECLKRIYISYLKLEKLKLIDKFEINNDFDSFISKYYNTKKSVYVKNLDISGHVQ